MTYPNCKATKSWPKTGHWLRADPVSIITSHDAAYMQGNAGLSITGDEQEQLLDMLNNHLEEDEMRIYPLNDKVWYLHSVKSIECTAPPPLQMLNQPIDVQVFKSQRMIDWPVIFTELQMLLYNHPVNELRRSQGAPEISALWFWQPSLWQNFISKLRAWFSKINNKK